MYEVYCRVDVASIVRTWEIDLFCRFIPITKCLLLELVGKEKKKKKEKVARSFEAMKIIVKNGRYNGSLEILTRHLKYQRAVGT